MKTNFAGYVRAALVAGALLAGCVPPGGESLCSEAEAHVEMCTGSAPPPGMCTEDSAVLALDLTCEELNNPQGKSDFLCHPGLSWTGYCEEGESLQDRGEYTELINRVLTERDYETDERVAREGAQFWIALENELYTAGFDRIVGAELDLPPSFGDFGLQPFRLTATYGAAEEFKGCTTIVADGQWPLVSRSSEPSNFEIEEVTAFEGPCDAWATAKAVDVPSVSFGDRPLVPHNLELFEGPFELESWHNVERWEGGDPHSNDRSEATDAAKLCTRALLLRIESIWNYRDEADDDRFVGQDLFARLGEETEWGGSRLRIIIEDLSLGGSAFASGGRISSERVGGVSASPSSSVITFSAQAEATGSCVLPTLASLETFADTCVPALADPELEGQCTTAAQ